MPNPAYKAVCFDLDGTLLNTLNDLGNSTNTVLSNAGFPTHPIESYRQFVGSGALQLIERALPEDACTEKNVQNCLRGFEEEYQKNWDNETCLYPGVKEMLDYMCTQTSLKLCVLSNKPHVFTLQCVQKFFSDWNFEVVFGQREGIPRKPDPAGALEIAQKLDIQCKEVAYLGDSSVDMETATSANFFAVGALWGFRSKEELIRTGADAVVENPQEFVDLVCPS